MYNESRSNEIHIGSDFDDFLAEEGLLEEAETVAVKRVLAFQIREMMESQSLSKAEMARRMRTSRAALERLLDPENRSVTLNTMDKAARSLGKRLRLTLM
jgi:predicted XRE-type DNA-binding protein